MASESSSAVLELNDADAEDTDALSVTDDPPDGIPLIMEHGYDIAVKVDAPMKQLSTLETFVTYRVRCACARWPTPGHVRRRYNHFKVLHKRLCASHPLLAPPPLPPLHSARQQLDRYSPSFVAVRTLALHAFLERVAKHPILTHSDDFRIFITTPDEELDKVFRSENSALNLWGLSSALYGGGGAGGAAGGGEARPANGARVKDPEFSTVSEYLGKLQHKLGSLCALTTKLHKGGAALRADLAGMKRACDAWSTQAGGAGVARAAGGCAAGAGRAAAALAHAPPPLRHRALLPLLAAHAHAITDKIRQRDAVHAAHVSGTNSDELHNRLEQASEALRSELSDWVPKTHAEIKSLLLELADRQVAIHSQSLQGWEHALGLSTETDLTQLFKTVSKTAVQNLSPSKSRPDVTPNETERDFDDIYNDDDDSIQELRFNDGAAKSNDGSDGRLESNSDVSKFDDWSKIDVENGVKDSASDGSDGSKFKDPLLDILEGSKTENGAKVDSNGAIDTNGDSQQDGSRGPAFDNGSRREGKPDPLQDFSEVDLSS